MAKSKSDLILEVINEIIEEGRKKVNNAASAMRKEQQEKLLGQKPVAALIKKVEDIDKQQTKLNEQLDALKKQRKVVTDELESKHKVEWSHKYNYETREYNNGWTAEADEVAIKRFVEERSEKLQQISRDARLAVGSSRAPELAMIAAMAQSAVEEL